MTNDSEAFSPWSKHVKDQGCSLALSNLTTEGLAISGSGPRSRHLPHPDPPHLAVQYLAPSDWQGTVLQLLRRTLFDPIWICFTNVQCRLILHR